MIFEDSTDREIFMSLSKSAYFVNHVKSHLKEGDKVICKICGKTVDEIWDEE